jgi:hypothetical protein
VNTLYLGFGSPPGIELTQLAGCAHEIDPARGGWVPKVYERRKTTVSGLFAAGETAGVGGAGNGGNRGASRRSSGSVRSPLKPAPRGDLAQEMNK